MYKKVSVVLGALALMVALGFGASQSYAGGEGKMYVCHNDKIIVVGESQYKGHYKHGDPMWETLADAEENCPSV